MKLSYRCIIVIVSFLALLYGFLIFANPSLAYYACGQGPCDGPPGGTYPCNAPYDCNPNPGGVCGVFYDACSGLTCVDNGGFDSGAGGCATGNQCAPINTTRTASYTYGACTTNCGNNTRVGTCTDGGQNNCPGVYCPSPSRAPGGTYTDTSCACVECVSCTPACGQARNCSANCPSTDVNNWGSCSVTCGNGTKSDPCGNSAACCISQIPNNTPFNVTCDQSSPTARTANVTWDFNDTGSNCGLAWGLNCSGNSNDFLINYSDPKTDETATSGLRSDLSSTFPDWGTYTVQVCARNGYGQRCSPAVNCVLTPPSCTSSGQDVVGINPDTACTNTNPSLSASWGNNANQLRFLIDNNIDLSSPLQQSSWLTSSPASITPAPTLATGTYYWNVRTQSTASPVDCVTPAPAAQPTGKQLNIDRTAPAIPAGSFTALTPDGSCPGRYKATFSWNAVTDTGCASLPAAPYQAQIDTDNGFAPAAHDSGWTSDLFFQTPIYYGAGSTLYAHVQSRDSLNNSLGWSVVGGTSILALPSPTPFPTIWVRGEYEEDVGTGGTPTCVGGMTVDPNEFDIALNITGNGASYTCDKYPTYWECFITIDNQGDLCSLATHEVGLTASYTGYDEVEWREGNNCGDPPVPTIGVIAQDVVNTPTPIKAFIQYGSKGWFKTSNAAFTNKATRQNVIPNNVVAFDGEDNTQQYLSIGQAGTMLYNTAGKNLDLGGNATAHPTENNWYSAGYDSLSLFSPAKFLDYVKSRKKYFVITNPSEIGEDGIYYVEGNLALSDATAFNNRKILVIVGGSLSITSNFIPASGSVGFIADSVIIGGGVTQVNAIIVGNRVDVGDSQNKLKIDGNLIQLTTSPVFANSRVLTNAQSPSLFIKVNQGTYMDLLPYLSTSMYDWRQIQ